MISVRLRTLFFALCYVVYSSVASAQEEFTVWLTSLKQEAIEAGVSDKTVTAAINHVELLPDIIQLDLAQPEFISPFLDYYQQRVDALKIARGRELLVRHAALLNQIEAQYGVPKVVLVAFWGMETNYGRYQGHVDTLSALATLAYDGRRAGFFRSQLLDAMRMMDAGNASVDQFRGSWAGAFGHMQFMPTTFITYAVDGDGDGHIDIVNSEADALASAANYLSQVGWQQGESTMIEVQLPENFEWQNAQLILRKSTKDWERLGVAAIQNIGVIDEVKLVQTPTHIKKVAAKKRKISHKLKVANIKRTASKPCNNIPANMAPPSVTQSITGLTNASGQAAILLPQGWRGPAFMVFDNFDAIMDWNHSVNYALSVVQLAKRINQEPPIFGGQYAEAGALTFQQMFELQSTLNERGYGAGEPDGFPGLQTQAAIRAYQLSQRLPADGYASPSLFRSIKLKQESNDAVEKSIVSGLKTSR